MKALILAAGLGTRLQGMAANKPKPLMEIGGEPLLGLLIAKLQNAGVSEFVINTHHRAEQIEQFIASQGLKDIVTLVYEEKLLGTAGTLMANIDLLNDEDFFVLHGDNYFTDSLTSMVDRHMGSAPDIDLTMGTFVTDKPESTGTVVLDSELRVTSFYEKDGNSPSRIANAAIFLMKPTVTEQVLALSNHENDISRDLIPKFVKRILTHPFSGEFIDIGTPESLEAARKLAEL